MSVWHALMQDLAPADSHEAGFHAARLELWDIMRRAVVTGLAVSIYICIRIRKKVYLKPGELMFVTYCHAL